MTEKGPIYGVELIDSLPLNRDKPDGMRQAMPNAGCLELHTPEARHRVVAGYEVLLNTWREEVAEVARLRALLARCHKVFDAAPDNIAYQYTIAEECREFAAESKDEGNDDADI